MVFSWLHDVQLLSLGVFAPIINGLGYGGSGLVSFSKISELMKELNQGIKDYFKIEDPSARQDMALYQIQNMLKIALFTCMTAWAAIGSIHAIVGGATLFAVMDSCFYYALIAFLANLGFFLFAPSVENSNLLSHTHIHKV